MKKTISISSFILLFIFTGTAQFYFRAGGGGGFGFPQYEDSYRNSFTNYYFKMVHNMPVYTGSTNAYEDVNSTYGTGLNGSLAFGRMIMKYIGFEIAFNEFFGRSVKVYHWFYYKEPWNRSNCYEETRWGMMFQAIPSIVLTPGFKKFNPYARLGLILGLLPQFYQKSLSYGMYFSTYQSVSASRQYYGGLPVGFEGTLGLDYQCSRAIALFAEMNFNLLNYTPKYSSIDPRDETTPAPETNLTGTKLSFSNFQINVGCKILLEK